MLVVVRRRALTVDSLATPTLIIGAGVIAGHLASRLLNDASYGLRPVGLLGPRPAAGKRHRRRVADPRPSAASTASPTRSRRLARAT